MRPTLCLAALVLAITLAVPQAHAACQDIAFSVNDYGKKGPAEDAKKLLDKFIAKYMKQHGIKKYRVGKKRVTCELFLDFIVFDEYTCKAKSKVCWRGKSIEARTAKKRG